jgi:hypothetical protein
MGYSISVIKKQKCRNNNLRASEQEQQTYTHTRPSLAAIQSQLQSPNMVGSHEQSPNKMLYLSAGVGCVVGVAAGTGATGCSSLGSAPKGSSLSGPLVALMPAAGFEAGISGISRGAGFGGAAASVDVPGVSTGFASASLGASVVDVWAEAAFGGAGATAPAGSGADRRGSSVYGYL